MIDIKNYFKDTLKFVFNDEIYTVDESADTFMKFQTVAKEMEKSGTEIEILNEMFNYAFGKEKAKKLLKLEVDGVKLPMSALLDISEKIIESWSGKKSNTPSV